MSGRGQINIGASGWHYKHWKGPFYPEDIRNRDMLEYYVKYFQTVEVNNSFYRLPQKETFAAWREATPDGFVFAVKGSRYITHMKRLKDPEQPVSTFMERAEALEDKLGPVLFQLPPNWGRNLERLKDFLKALPSGRRFAFEFRDPSWFSPETEEALSSHNAAFCIYDIDWRQSPRSATADFVYIRLHGPDGAYKGRYSEEALKDWAGAITDWAKDGRDVFCYFDNDQNAYAVKDALGLIDLLGGEKALRQGAVHARVT